MEPLRGRPVRGLAETPALDVRDVRRPLQALLLGEGRRNRPRTGPRSRDASGEPLGRASPSTPRCSVAACFFEKSTPRPGAGDDREIPQQAPVRIALGRANRSVRGPPRARRSASSRTTASCWSSPRGREGTAKLFPERNSLVEFGTGFLRLALKTKTPIIPFGFLGGGEAIPTVANAYAIGKLLGVPYIPVTPTASRSRCPRDANSLRRAVHVHGGRHGGRRGDRGLRRPGEADNRAAHRGWPDARARAPARARTAPTSAVDATPGGPRMKLLVAGVSSAIAKLVVEHSSQQGTSRGNRPARPVARRHPSRCIRSTSGSAPPKTCSARSAPKRSSTWDRHLARDARRGALPDQPGRNARGLRPLPGLRR